MICYPDIMHIQCKNAWVAMQMQIMTFKVHVIRKFTYLKTCPMSHDVLLGTKCLANQTFNSI